MNEDIQVHDFGPPLEDGLPSAYLQAQLHGNEVQGNVVLKSLVARLSEQPSRAFLGSIRIVPSANPCGAAQYMAGGHGMYDRDTGRNWNRIFDWTDLRLLELIESQGSEPTGVCPRLTHLEHLLLRLSFGYSLVVDIHTPDYGVEHVYCSRYDQTTPTFGVTNVVEYGQCTLPSFDQAQIMLARAANPDREVTSLTIEIDSHTALTRELVDDWTERLLGGLAALELIDRAVLPLARAPEDRMVTRGIMRDYIAPASGPYVAEARLGIPVSPDEPLMTILPYDARIGPQTIRARQPCVPLCWRRETVVVEGCWAVRALSYEEEDAVEPAVSPS